MIASRAVAATVHNAPYTLAFGWKEAAALKASAEEPPIALTANRSVHAIRMRSDVAGECSEKWPLSSPVPLGWGICSARAAATASRIAKKTAEPRKKGGSPTALDEWTAKGLATPVIKLTLKTRGVSLNEGILYAPGPCVSSRPAGCTHAWSWSAQMSSSVVVHPMPCMKAPSIWPMSMAGLMAEPMSTSSSTRRTSWSPVSTSISTSAKPTPCVK
mmetsp:Transcript_15292/g.35184  ORF Transcript_15292/g.35184 Transcript_15292/m.35184 type:complete len:216 (+) Transcript_15292:365-1012(+)